MKSSGIEHARGREIQYPCTASEPRLCSDTGTYIARYDDLVNGKEEPIDVSQMDVSINGIELQDREFVAAIREGREPNSSVGQVLDCYRVIGELATGLEGHDGWS